MTKPSPTARVAAMAPYQLADLSAVAGVELAQLAQNESLRSPSPHVFDAARNIMGESALYPDPDWIDLRGAIAERHRLDPATLLCGAGSMELIAALAEAYLGPGDSALSSEHSYLFFRTAVALAGATIELVPETNLTVDIDKLIVNVRAETKVVFVANPGNPTGTRITREELLALRTALRDDILLIIDEAYGEFADDLDEPAFDFVQRGGTVVLRTFSKAYGLAGARVGWGVFPPDIATEVRKVLNPNNVSLLSQAMAAEAVRDHAYMRETVAQTAELRDRFARQFRGLGLDVPASHTNFLLLRFSSCAAAARADRALRAEGVLTRGMTGYGLSDCQRMTIGTEEQMQHGYDVLARLRDAGGL